MIAVVFPGQGSQHPGMGASLREHSAAAEVFARIDAATGISTRRICEELSEDELRQTQNAQLALYACGVAAHAALLAEGVEAQVAAGHSVGEYAALAAAEVLSIEDGARLVQRRGDLMARSGGLRAGTMAAVLGLDRDALEQVCRAASTPESVAVIANDNCPGQLVISGDVSAVERASALAPEAGAKRVMPINVSGAFHSPLMQESSEAMGLALRDVRFAKGVMPVVANVTAQVAEEGWADLLEAQLRSPVRWTESVGAMLAMGVTTFVECGSGTILSGLLKRIDREARSLAVEDADSLRAAVEALA
ncbi:MAG: ACP S-malonyltransferase [Methanoregulaceae archaeon]|nr:ACP S-malonyltransferase [Methanoregulaceae archaeon]